MIYVLNYAGLSPISAGIQLATWSRFSHSAIANKSGLTVEAWHIGGVDLAADPWENHTLGTPVIIYSLDISEAVAARIWDAVCGEIGKKYDFRALAGFIPATRWLWRDDSEKWFCSHLSAWACKKGGYPLFSEQTKLYKISPGLIDTSSQLKILGVVTDFKEFRQEVREETEKNTSNTT